MALSRCNECGEEPWSCECNRIVAWVRHDGAVCLRSKKDMQDQMATNGRTSISYRRIPYLDPPDGEPLEQEIKSKLRIEEEKKECQ